MLMKNKITWAIFLFSGMQLSSCNLLKNLVGRIDLDKPLATAKPQLDTITLRAGIKFSQGLDSNVTSIAKHLLSGLKGSMDTLDPDLKKLVHLIDSIGNLSAAQIKKIGDSLHIQLLRVKDDIKDSTLKNFLVNTVEAMTGKLKQGTKGLLGDLLLNALDSLKSQRGKESLNELVKTLFSDSNAQRTQQFISTALQPTMDSLASKIDRTLNRVHTEVGFVQRNAWWVIVGVGILALCIISYVWYERRKYRQLVGLLTYQIHRMPEQVSYDNVTQQIQSEAQRTGLEPLLRKSLQEQGINS